MVFCVNFETIPWTMPPYLPYNTETKRIGKDQSKIWKHSFCINFKTKEAHLIKKVILSFNRFIIIFYNIDSYLLSTSQTQLYI